jgi:type IV secretory pathway VirB4 component
MTPPAAHRATTAHLQALYPFVAEGAFGDRGAYIGRNLFGGGFVYDPWELYRAGAVTNPNVLVLGQIGRGKSSFVKAFLWRQQVFGRQAWVVDPKGEYGALAQASGTRPVRVAPGGAVRLNPLEPAAPSPDGHDLTRRRGELVCSLAAASLGRTLLPHERTAIELAVTSVSGRPPVPTIPAVVKTLLRPAASSASAVCSDVGTLAADGRAVALELRRLVQGDLAGMFDAPTSPGIEMDGRLVVLDLSALYASPALAILMTCAAAWLHAVLNRDDGIRRLVVVDEAWAILSNLAVARWLQASFKLSRALGVANVAVVHRLSDLRAAGGDGSEQQRLAEGLLADAETRVVFAQPPSEVKAATELLGLTTTEAELLPRLPRGVALWKIGSRSLLIEHRMGAHEVALIDTDARMAG